MTDRNDWNRRIIKEFRANDGKVGGNFEGVPLLLLHHDGARSGFEAERPNFAGYEKTAAGRQIPVVVLDPV